jgi:hypothetical protein
VDEEDVLVDQVGDRADQLAAAEDDQVLFGFQGRDVVESDDVRVDPVGVVQSG